ncbi:1174_t:CDS:2, partial [Funneliformis geosporum]
MVACFFAIIDNCNRTRLVATVLLEDETEDSFIWALKMIKKGTGHLIPRVVFTDSNLAMANAISLEFSDSIHCLCLNTLVLNIFEHHWESLKSKYTSANSYIKRQLDPFKHKWAVCYTNNQFTAGANSTQRVESLNRKIHDCIKLNSSLLMLVKEIQEVLNKESEYARVEEYKDQIPTVGLATVSKTYFNSIEKIVSQYLMPAIVFA